MYRLEFRQILILVIVEKLIKAQDFSYTNSLYKLKCQKGRPLLRLGKFQIYKKICMISIISFMPC